MKEASEESTNDEEASVSGQGQESSGSAQDSDVENALGLKDFDLTDSEMNHIDTLSPSADGNLFSPRVFDFGDRFAALSLQSPNADASAAKEVMSTAAVSANGASIGVQTTPLGSKESDTKSVVAGDSKESDVKSVVAGGSEKKDSTSVKGGSKNNDAVSVVAGDSKESGAESVVAGDSNTEGSEENQDIVTEDSQVRFYPENRENESSLEPSTNVARRGVPRRRSRRNLKSGVEMEYQEDPDRFARDEARRRNN